MEAIVEQTVPNTNGATPEEDSVGQEAPLVSPMWCEFNQHLVSNVHPNGWQNPTPTGRYNLVVIGEG